jgi:hypothetical protein
LIINRHSQPRAGARFHRPNSGNGLNDLAKASIKAARLLESRIKFWEKG